jgi:hypothetical protein
MNMPVSKPKLFGFISIGSGILSWCALLFLSAIALLFALMFEPKSWTADGIKTFFYFMLFIHFCVLCISGIGLVASGIGLFNKNHDKITPAIGAAISLLPFSGELIFFCILIYGYLTHK